MSCWISIVYRMDLGRSSAEKNTTVGNLPTVVFAIGKTIELTCHIAPQLLGIGHRESGCKKEFWTTLCDGPSHHLDRGIVARFMRPRIR